jgi:phosphoglycerol geranylgeranyltransferase
MTVFEKLQERRKSRPLHFTLIDPDRQEPAKAGAMARSAMELGTDAVLVGGSLGDAYGDRLLKTVEEIKKQSNLTVILFPNSAQQVAPNADAILFMSLLNSRSPQFLIGEQAKGAFMVKKHNIEPMGMGYMIIESGSTTSAAWVGDVNPIPRDKPEIAAGYALAAKYFGMKFIYLEAGSGAKYTVPPEMIAAVKGAVGHDTMVIVGGGIRSPAAAGEKVAAGADVIVTGTIVENDMEKFRSIMKAIKG